MTERYQMTLLYWDRNWSQNIRTSASIDHKVSQSVAEIENFLSLRHRSQSVAECRSILVQQFPFVAKCCKTKILRHSATLATFCDTLRFHGNQA